MLSIGHQGREKKASCHTLVLSRVGWGVGVVRELFSATIVFVAMMSERVFLEGSSLYCCIAGPCFHVALPVSGFVEAL